MGAEFRDTDDMLRGTLTLNNDGTITVSSDAPAYLDTLVVLEPDTGKRLTMADGERYLRALQYEFRGAYLRLVLIE